jgi:hypothetical protein
MVPGHLPEWAISVVAPCLLPRACPGRWIWSLLSPAFGTRSNPEKCKGGATRVRAPPQRMQTDARELIEWMLRFHPGIGFGSTDRETSRNSTREDPVPGIFGPVPHRLEYRQPVMNEPPDHRG